MTPKAGIKRNSGMKTVGITGGTGFVGRHLTQKLLDSGYEVVIFSRHPEHQKPRDGVIYAYWSAKKTKMDVGSLKNLDAVVHLAGAGLADKRWTQKRKHEITDSRVKGTNFIVSQLKQYAPNCKTFISTSAMGYYGPDKNGKPFTETDPAHTDFLAQTCLQWETAAKEAEQTMRTVILRFGLVMGHDGGAFVKFENPVTFGLVPIIGTGRQIISWIHIDDLTQLMLTAIEGNMQGIYNAVSPHPATQREVVKTIAAIKGGPKFTFKVPSFILKAMLGEMSKDILGSCTLSSKKLQDTGFRFQYPSFERAAADLLSK